MKEKREKERRPDDIIAIPIIPLYHFERNISPWLIGWFDSHYNGIIFILKHNFFYY